MTSSYTVHDEGSVVVITTTGSQTVEQVQALHAELEEVLKKSASKDVLVISSGAGAPDIAAQAEALLGLREVPFERLAAVAETPERLGSANLVVKAVNDKDNRIKVFRSEEDARAWLGASKSV